MTMSTALAAFATWGSGTAAAAVWSGSVDDPPDRRGEADVAAAALRYDDAGRLELRVRFHEPVEADDPTTIDWVVTAEADAEGCGDTRQGVAGLLEPRDGDTTLTYTEVPEDGIPVTLEMPARQDMSADRRELTVSAASAGLTGRRLRCTQLALSNGDEVDRIVLARTAGDRPSTGPPDVKVEDDGPAPGPPVGGLRVSDVHLRFDRRGRGRVVGSLRALVCAPPGMRVVAEVRERRRRVGTRRFGREHLHTYARRQRVRCELHRWRWRLRADPAARYQVRVGLRVRAVEAR